MSPPRCDQTLNDRMATHAPPPAVGWSPPWVDADRPRFFGQQFAHLCGRLPAAAVGSYFRARADGVVRMGSDHARSRLARGAVPTATWPLDETGTGACRDRLADRDGQGINHSRDPVRMGNRRLLS